jgi:hypothetical protein
MPILGWREEAFSGAFVCCHNAHGTPLFQGKWNSEWYETHFATFFF